MHLQSFLLVVISLSCGSLPPATVDYSRAIPATMGMIAAWWILCHLAARTTARQVQADRIDPLVGARLLEKQLDIFRWLALGVVVMCLGGFGIARGLDGIAVLEGSLFLQSLVLLLPAVMLVSASWSAEHRYGVLMDYAECGLKEHIGSVVRSFRSSMAWLVIPIMILLGLADGVSRLPLTEIQAGLLMVVVSLLFVCAGLPWLVSRLFKTSRLDDTTEAWVRSLLFAARLQRIRIVRWQTGGATFNALITGFVPPIRTLLLSDRLMDELPRDQIAMVVLHEAAHLRRRHMPLRMLSILPAWGIGTLITRIAGDAPYAMAAGSLAGIVLTMLILRWVAYRTEFDADVQACRLAEKISGDVEEVPTTYASAAAALSAALLRVTEGHPETRRRTWLHPGVVDRIECMRRYRKTPATNNTTAGTVANPA
ncbi:M48 family metalloprotease [Novipirellula artificiosorum]|uniref:Peptidase family M48 n=1 Tax=Novipirellula artificiosorum TaxID=2528016 RepID=A0A5C6E0I1_9BACT|nr:M48 family metalloprotease [Novipirellula artificiosorum]TWU42004.1 Peptidase family M48 [Novipirellula artificiosorum]